MPCTEDTKLSLAGRAAWARRALAGSILAVFMVGCGTHATALRRHAASELDCPAFEVTVERDAEGFEHASGCGRQVIFDWLCDEGDCAWQRVRG